MIEDEWSDVAVCIACGVPTWPEAERAYACSSESYLCYRCAERRGGVYDERRDRWVVEPDLVDLAGDVAPAANE